MHCGHLQCCHQHVREEPAAPAGLTSLAGDATPGHRAQRDHLRRCHQCVGEGPAAPAGVTSIIAMQRHAIVLSMVTYIGLTPLASDAALDHRAGRDLLHWRYQCVRKGPAAPAGQTIVTTGL